MTAPDRLPLLAERLGSELRRLVFAAAAASVLLPLGMIVYAGLTGQRYYRLFWGEENAITWYSSVQLLVVAAVAYGNLRVIEWLRRFGRATGTETAWVWGLFSMGFLFLGLDEFFQFHEWLRDDVLAPRDRFAHIPFLRPGDIGLYVYFAAGLVAAFFLYRELKQRRAALVLFGGALALTLATMVIDSLPEEIEEHLSYFWTSVFEEVGELWAQVLFLLSFATLLKMRLGRLGGDAPD